MPIFDVKNVIFRNLFRFIFHFIFDLCHILFSVLSLHLFFFLFLVILFHLNKNNQIAAYSDKSACSIASGGSSSIGGNSTATLGNDYPSLTASDDFPDEIEFSTNYGKNVQISKNNNPFTTIKYLDYTESELRHFNDNCN